MVGSAIVRVLRARGERSLLLRTRDDLDLTSQAAVGTFFSSERPDQVYLVAARVGGIHANHTYPAEFIYQNLMIAANVIHAAFLCGVRKLLFLGSSCMYPRLATQPMSEDALLSGVPEPTNEPYAIAKIAGIKLCESYNRQFGTRHGIDYRSVIPTNLYGPGDNYHPQDSHVIPALIQKFHEAKVARAPSVTIWGTGTPRREFLHVDDLATACVHIMELNGSTFQAHTSPHGRHVNVGSGEEVSISALAEAVRRVVGFEGNITFDPTKPDGAPRKLLDSSTLLRFGWNASISLESGLRETYEAFLAQAR